MTDYRMMVHRSHPHLVTALQRLREGGHVSRELRTELRFHGFLRPDGTISVLGEKVLEEVDG